MVEAIKLNKKLPLTGSGARTMNKLHVSDIYTDIEKTLFPKKTNADMNNPLWAELGFMFEEIIKSKHNIISIGELEHDGILMTPDGFVNGQLYEIKCTWRSNRLEVKDIWRWNVQVMAYAYALGVQTCEFHVLYVMGNYKGSGPIYDTVMMYYTEREIIENWGMLVNHAKSKGWV